MLRFSWQVFLDAHPHLRDSLVVVFWLSAMTFLGRTFFLHEMDNSIVIMLYLLTVFFISRFTSGYIYGVIGSFLSVFLFNFFFTEPYYSIDVYDAKYPMIFFIMLIVSLVTSAMTLSLIHI